MADKNRLDEVQQKILDSIISSMETEGRAWVRGWSFNGLPMNGTTGRQYNGRNAFLLWAQMLFNDITDPRFLTFKQAKVPKHANNLDDVVIDAIVSSSPCKVEERLGARAFYSLREDRIEVPTREQFLSTTSMAHTLLHEMCHATGSVDRLKRPGFAEDEKLDSQTRALEELVAELGSVYTANAIGLDLSNIPDDPAAQEATSFENTVAYLKSWAEATPNAKASLMKQASAASQACTWLVNNCFKPKLGEEMLRGVQGKETHSTDVMEELKEQQNQNLGSEQTSHVIENEPEHLMSEQTKQMVVDAASKAGFEVEVYDTNPFDQHVTYISNEQGIVFDVPTNSSMSTVGLLEDFVHELDYVEPNDARRPGLESLARSLAEPHSWYIKQIGLKIPESKETESQNATLKGLSR